MGRRLDSGGVKHRDLKLSVHGQLHVRYAARSALSATVESALSR
jgi:hypothetical protein